MTIANFKEFCTLLDVKINPCEKDTTQQSIPNAIARKITSAKERARLKSIVSLIKPVGVGVIVRTEAEGQTEAEIQDDLEMLLEKWNTIVTAAESHEAPCIIHRDQDLLYRVIREECTEDVTKITVDTAFAHQRVTQLLQAWNMNKNITVEIIEQVEEIPKANPYWDYIKMNLINVNFMELKNINSDTKGWIQVNGTNINYPFVQTSNNKYYLNRSFDKSYNNAGWVFLDYRNSINNLSKNTIIYAHGRLDTTMFGSLKNILSSGWLDNTDNYIVKLSTETENTLWQVFSVYHIPTTSDYIQVNFSSNEEFTNWTTMLINRSSHNFNTEVYESDSVLTLSTCYNDDDKVVLHAKLIKKETR